VKQDAEVDCLYIIKSGIVAITRSVEVSSQNRMKYVLQNCVLEISLAKELFWEAALFRRLRYGNAGQMLSFRDGSN